MSVGYKTDPSESQQLTELSLRRRERSWGLQPPNRRGRQVLHATQKPSVQDLTPRGQGTQHRADDPRNPSEGGEDRQGEAGVIVDPLVASRKT